MQVFSFVLYWQSQSGGGSLLFGIGPIILIFGIFYFLLIMPQQRKQKQWREMLGNLKTGDNVTTTGGIRGTIVALRDDDIHLRVPPDNIRIAVARNAIAGISVPDEAKKTS